MCRLNLISYPGPEFICFVFSLLFLSQQISTWVEISWRKRQQFRKNMSSKGVEMHCLLTVIRVVHKYLFTQLLSWVYNNFLFPSSWKQTTQVDFTRLFFCSHLISRPGQSWTGVIIALVWIAPYHNTINIFNTL